MLKKARFLSLLIFLPLFIFAEERVKEQEPAKLEESTEQEPAKLEKAEQEPAKFEESAEQEPAKLEESAKQEPEKLEESAEQEPAKLEESTEQEPAKLEKAKQEPAKLEEAKQEPAKLEESAKQEPAKLEERDREELERLKREIKRELLAEIKAESSKESVERQKSEKEREENGETGKAKSLLDPFEFHGRIKARYEYEDLGTFNSDSNSDGKTYGVTNHRGLFEAKAAVIFKPCPYVNAGLGVASGGSFKTTSSMQEMNSHSALKPLNLDLAYIQINPFAVFPKTKDVSLFFGKFRNRLFKAGGSEMVWDNDFNPEGGAFDFKVNVGKIFFFGDFTLSVFDENRSKKYENKNYGGKDPLLLIAQFGGGADAANVKFNFGISYYGLQNLPDDVNELKATEALEESNLNQGDYRYDFNVLGLDSDISYALNRYLKFSLSGQFYINLTQKMLNIADKEGRDLDVAELPNAFSVGFALSSEKMNKLGDYSIGFRFLESDANSLLNSFTSSTYFRGEAGYQIYQIVLKVAIWSRAFFEFNFSHQRRCFSNWFVEKSEALYSDGATRNLMTSSLIFQF